jgi:uncharacterized repeat protein (TIGR03803 family)
MRSTVMIIVACGSLLVGCGAPGPNVSTESVAGAQRSGTQDARRDQPRFKLLYAFPNHTAGNLPYGSLLPLNGSLYGTTSYGGSECGHYGCGTVFSLSLKPSVKETVLHSFDDLDAPDGDRPYSGVTALGISIYGTTDTSRAGIGDGVVYSVNLKSNVETVLHQFQYSRDGRHPIGGMAAIGRTLYGTTSLGYALHGSVFSIDTSGHETIVYRFRGRPDGAVPEGDLLAIGNVLYGTTEFGGSNPGKICTQDSNNMEIGCGTVFSITLGPSGPKETVLHKFQGGADDGTYPQGGLIYVNGLLYGVTPSGGQDNGGTVFSIKPSTGQEIVIYNFKGGNDASYPVGNLAHFNGMLYGAAYGGGIGSKGGGSVFSLKLDGSGETVLHEFAGGRKDGASPEAGVVLSNGIIYGTTGFGGNGTCTNGCGTIYSVTPH